MKPLVLAMVLLAAVRPVHAEPDPVPEAGVALVAGAVGQQRASGGGQLELGWSVGRVGLSAEASLLGVASDNASTGRTVWLGASGRFALLDAINMRASASGAREMVSSSLLLEVVIQREWWEIFEHLQPPPVGPDRYTLGIGLSGRFRIVDERVPSLMIGTRVFARALASETPIATASSGTHYARATTASYSAFRSRSAIRIRVRRSRPTQT